MTKKEKLLDYLSNKREDQELFCIQIIISSGQIVSTTFDMCRVMLISYIDNYYNDDLVTVQNDEELKINSWLLKQKDIEV